MSTDTVLRERNQRSSVSNNYSAIVRIIFEKVGSAGLSFEAPTDRFSRAPQIFPKFFQGSSVIFL